MVRTRLILIALILFVGAGVFLAFAPWSGSESAKERAISVFNGQQKGRTDGCGLGCKNCGAKSVRKVLFGYYVKLEFACGILPNDEEKFHQTREVFVGTFF